MANCPACNAEIIENEGRTNRFCENCGKPLPVPESPKEAPHPEELLEKACLLMNMGRHTMAQPLIEETLRLYPEYADAYIVKLLCRLGLKQIEELETLNVPLDSYEEFEKAVQLSTPAQLKRLAKLHETNAQNIAGKQQCSQEQLSQLDKQIDEAQEFLDTNAYKVEIPTWRKVLRIIEKIFMICTASFWVLGTIYYWMLAFIAAPFVIRLAIIIRRDIEQKQLPKKIEQAQQTLAECRAERAKLLVALHATTE